MKRRRIMIKRKWFGIFGFLILLALPSLSLAYDNSPNWHVNLPETIYASATGGGTWVSEVQIIDRTGGSVVSCYFNYGGGNYRYIYNVWTGPGANYTVRFSNMLYSLGLIDTGFSYYGRVGALDFFTQDSSHKIIVTCREYNGNYSKTMPGLNYSVDANTASYSPFRPMVVPNLANNSTYRATCGFYNPTSITVTCRFYVTNNTWNYVGAYFDKTFVGFDFQVFNPFVQAGVPYPSYSYTNMYLYIYPIGGTGTLFCFGATANNYSNDPASHLAVQWD